MLEEAWSVMTLAGPSNETEVFDNAGGTNSAALISVKVKITMAIT